MLRNLIKDKRSRCALLASLVFLGVSLPATYYFTDELIGSEYAVTYYGFDNCPTPVGKFLHAGIFFVILYFLMKYFDESDKSDGLIAKYSFYATLLFLVVSSRDAYALTSQLPGMSDGVSSIYDGLYNGCPTKKGVIVHSIVYLVLLVLVMSFPKDE